MSRRVLKFKNTVNGVVVNASLMIGGVMLKDKGVDIVIPIEQFLQIYLPMSEDAQRAMQFAYGELKEVAV